MYTITTAVKNAFLNGDTMSVGMVVRKGNQSVTIAESDVVEDSFYIDRTATNVGELFFGAAPSNELGFTLRNHNNTYTPSFFDGAYIDVTFYVYINGVKTTACEGGRFYVINAPKRRKEITITAYGCLIKADIPNSRAGDSGYTTYFQLMLNNIASDTGLTISSLVTLPTTTLYKFKYPDGSDVTNRFLLGWIAALSGAMVREHGNSDSVQLVKSQATGITINSSNRFPNGTYEDTITLTGVSAYDSSDTKFSAGTDGYRLEIHSNGVFDQAYNMDTDASYKQALVNGVWNLLNGFSMTPCYYNILNMPFLECGDQITFVDDYGNNKTTTLTKVHITYTKTTIESTGLSESQNTIASALPSTIARDSISREMIQTDALKSTNYVEGSDPDFSSGGTFFNLKDGLIKSKNFVIKSNGDAKFKGNVEATTGRFGYLFLRSDANGGGFDFEPYGNAESWGKVEMGYDNSALVPYLQLFGSDVYIKGEITPDGIFFSHDEFSGGGGLYLSVDNTEDTAKLILSDTVFLSDNLTTKLKDRLGGSGGTSNFNDLTNRPKYGGSVMTGSTNIPLVNKSNVGLGSVVNTGDSATPVSGGTTKFTTGGAYTELNKKQDKLTARSAALTSLEAQLVVDGFQKCLIEGTKITMADGSYKNIEDIQTGDVVLSYNPNTKKNVNAVILRNINTGLDQYYDTMVFDNGDTLEIAHGHMLWNETYQAIHISSDTITSKVRMEDGTINGVAQSIRTRHTVPKWHYTLISSNNLYYANGVLVGHDDSDKYMGVVKSNFAKVPEDISERWRKNGIEYDTRRNAVVDKEVVSKCISILKEYRTMQLDVQNAENQLSSGDHEDNKALEVIVNAFKKMATGSFVAFIKGFKEMVSQLASYTFENRDALREEIKTKRVKRDSLWSDYQKEVSNAFGEEKTYGAWFLSTVEEGNKDFDALLKWADEFKKSEEDTQNE